MKQHSTFRRMDVVLDGNPVVTLSTVRKMIRHLQISREEWQAETGYNWFNKPHLTLRTRHSWARLFEVDWAGYDGLVLSLLTEFQDGQTFMHLYAPGATFEDVFCEKEELHEEDV
jgi:hypothetical protein